MKKSSLNSLPKWTKLVSLANSVAHCLLLLIPIPHAEELVKGLVTSKDHTSTARALEKADQYIQSPAAGEEVKTSQDRTVINRTESPKTNGAKNGGMSVGGVTRDNEVSQGDFLRSLEEDAKERAERRKEREARGKEAKKKGNRVFKAGDFEGAVRCFTEGIKEAPWDITLYTNRALVSRFLFCCIIASTSHYCKLKKIYVWCITTVP